MNQLKQDLIYLLACAIHGVIPDKARTAAIDLDQLFRFCKWHSLRGIVHLALKSAGIKDKTFEDAYNKVVRKNVMLDIERNAILDDFEQHGIWYLPLKGSILKEYYPENGMREMADNDVLYDSSRQSEVKDIMLGKGYTAESVGKDHHDIYIKHPVLNFELHTSLFEEDIKSLYNYYLDTRRLMKPDDGKKYGYHFSDEDFYVYVTAHEYKHFKIAGVGIRNLLDCYVFMKNKGESLDWDYIKEQCRQLEMDDFEEKRRLLAMKLFSSAKLPVLNDTEQELLRMYLDYGTYGTVEKQMSNMMPEKTKFRNILRNMFPTPEYMKISVGFVKKYPFLYPLGIVYRWGRVLLIRKKYLFTMLRVMKKNDKKKV